jgi:CSLREA domain-containing protein
MAAALALVAVLAPSVARGATITPNVFTDELDNSNATCSLREAISIANADVNTAEPDCPITGTLGNDTIALGTGEYVLELPGSLDQLNATGDLDVNTTSQDLTIDGVSAGQTTIATDSAPPWTDRVLDQNAGAGTLTVSDVTVTGGNETDGFGGGGIASATGGLVVERVRVTDNHTESGGGGLSVNSNSAAISDSTIDLNTSNGATGGGGLTLGGGTVTIASTVIKQNSVEFTDPGDGGGLASFNAAVTVTGSVISGNSVTDTDASGTTFGGGILWFASTGTIRGTTVSGNEVAGPSNNLAGGIRVAGSGGNLKLVNDTISGNEALGGTGSSGGLRVEAGAATVAHTTFGPNPVGNQTTAIGHSGGTVTVRGSIIDTIEGFGACDGSPTSGDDNVFAGLSCGPTTGNDVADADPMLGALADNGGPDAGAPGFEQPILTHLPAAASAAVDHVPAADCDDEPAGSLLIDQRGLTRPFDSDGDSVAECEAGSLEIQSAPQPPPGGGSPPPAATPVKKRCKKGQKLKKGRCVKKKRKKK